MAIKIMLLTQWFDPEQTIKGVLFAKELLNQGFEVEVVTGFPNYPGGKLYPGYKLRLLQREKIDGVSITRVPLYPSHNGSSLKRVFNYISFGFSSMIYGLFLAKKPDVIYVYHPPLTTGIAALIVRIVRRVPVIYDIQDMWPDTLAATGMLKNKKLLNLIGLVCRCVYKFSDKILVLSPGFKLMLIKRGVAADKITVIYNWCNEAGLNITHSTCLNELVTNNNFCVMFAGNMGQAQGLSTVLDAAEKLSRVRSDISFILLGTGTAIEEIKQQIRDKNITNVICLPRVPMNEVTAFLDAADVLLVHLRDDPLFRITIPSKTQAYMMAGKPILMAVSGDAADLVEAAGCGIVATPENADSLVEAVLKLAELSDVERHRMGENGRDFYIKNLSLASGVEKISEQVRSLVKERTLMVRKK